MERIHNIFNHLTPTQISSKSPDDVVICSAVRTAITKAKKGLFKDTTPDIMLAAVLKEAATRANIDPKQIEDIAIGNNLMPAAGEIPNRMAMFLAGFPETVPIIALNRLCSSGL